MRDVYDEDGWVEDADFLARMGLDRPEIAARMGITYECLEGRIRRAERARKVERTDAPLRPAGFVATRAFLMALV